MSEPESEWFGEPRPISEVAAVLFIRWAPKPPMTTNPETLDIWRCTLRMVCANAYDAALILEQTHADALKLYREGGFHGER